jgi:rhodanese-related sulfurtransferase
VEDHAPVRTGLESAEAVVYLQPIAAAQRRGATDCYVGEVGASGTEKFVGHADMAWNIPLAFQTYNWDSTEQEFSIRLNPEFVTQVTEQFTFDDTLLVMCRSGGRSALAVNLLAEAGFKNAFTVTDGMEGDLDKHLDADHSLAEAIRKVANLYADQPLERPTGYGYESDTVSRARRTKNGWKNSGLPWTYEINPERMILPM